MRAFPMSRAGFSLLEVMVALAILGGSLIGLSEYGRRFARVNSTAMLQNSAMDLATARLERVKAERSYASMDTMAGTRPDTVITSGVPMVFTRTTTIVRTQTLQVDYKTITVTVTRPNMPAPVKKTTAVARF